MPSQLSVLLADSHPMIRSGLRTLLSTAPGIAVAAEASTADELAREAQLQRPDVVILDPQRDVTIIREICRSTPGTAVLAFTTSDHLGSVAEAIRAGARGYLLKTAQPNDVIRAVHSLAAGQVIFGARIAPQVTNLLSRQRGNPLPFTTLTGREHQVLDYLAAGLPNATIARRLHLAPKTIRNNISAIFSKLDVTDRAEAIARARAAGLGR